MAEYLDKTGLTYLCSKIKAKFDAKADKTALDAKADKTTADALGKRIDNLILSSGTESSAEVVDARTGYDGTAHDTLGTAIRNQISELKSDLDNIDNILSYTKTTEFDSVENGKVYNRSDTSGVSLGGYDSYHKNVDENKVYYISTTVVGVNNYSAVLFYGNSGYIGSAGDYETVGGSRITDFEFKTPIGTTEIIVTIENWRTHPTLKEKEYIDIKNINVNKFAKNFVKVEDGVVYIKAKYNLTGDICFVFKKRGGNNIVDFDKVFTVENASLLNNDFTVARNIFTNSTDFFSPHIISADSNRDGDNIDSYYFTGGNHRTTNTDAGGGVTANTTSFNIYADEVSVPQNGCYCNKVVLDWVNDVQAFNTSKSDGSGRGVLEEHITLTIVGSHIECKITHKAKEPLKRLVYYGLQALTTGFDNVRFVGGSNRGLYPTISDSTKTSGNKICRDIELTNSSDMLSVHIDSIDLGDFSYDENDYSVFNVGYGKSYFNIIKRENSAPLSMSTGDITEVRGYYDFISI